MNTTVTAALDEARAELQRTEDAAARAGWALAEIEEKAEEGMGAELAEAIGAATARLEAAERRLERARARVREMGG